MNVLCIAGFLGWKRYLAYRSLERFDQPWGWKDPRNVFTLPLWLRVFPEAKIIYIVRNGVDVAASLLVLSGFLLNFAGSLLGPRPLAPGPPLSPAPAQPGP